MMNDTWDQNWFYLYLPLSTVAKLLSIGDTELEGVLKFYLFPLFIKLKMRR